MYDVSIPNGKLSITSNQGDISMHNIACDTWQFSTNSGDIYLSDATLTQGDLLLTTQGDISVYDVMLSDGGIFLHTETGDIRVHDVLFNDFEFKTVNGDISLNGFHIIDKDLSLKTTGDIVVYEGVLENSELGIDTSEGDIIIGNIHLDNQDLILSTMGNIIVYDTNTIVTATSSEGDIAIANTTGISDISTEKGDITMEVYAIQKDVIVTTQRGSIELFFDPACNIAVNAQVHATIGGIFLLSLRSILSLGTKSFKSLDGTIGSGGYTLNARIGNEAASEFLGGFIYLKKIRQPLFPLSLISDEIVDYS